MKRRTFLEVTGIGRSQHCDCGAAIAQCMPELKRRMTASWPKALDTIHGGADQMCKVIAEATDNKLHVEPLAAGEIGPVWKCRGRAELALSTGHTSSHHYFGKDPTSTFGTSLPFGRNARLIRPGTCGGGESAQRIEQSYNVTSLLAGNTTRHTGGWSARRSRRSRSTAWKFRIGGFAGTHHAEARAVPSSSPAATSIRRWRKAPSTPPSGLAPTMTRSSASTRSRLTTTTQAGGKADRCCSPMSISINGTRCRSTIRRSLRRQAPTPTTG